MLNYLEHLVETTSWTPFSVPGLSCPSWLEKFEHASLSGKRNIAHAWFWELNLELKRRHYNRSCPGLISILAEHTKYILLFGRYCNPDVTSEWFLDGTSRCIANILCYDFKYPNLDEALGQVWSLDSHSQINGLCILESFHYVVIDKEPFAYEDVCKILHDFTWLTLVSTNTHHVTARYVGYLFIPKLAHKYTFSSDAVPHENDDVAFVWHQFSHIGYERDSFTKEGEDKLRSDVLARPVRERFEVLQYLAQTWLSHNVRKEKAELTTIIEYDGSIYNWFIQENSTVYDLMAQWLPELSNPLAAAQATNIFLHELRSYLFNQDAQVMHMGLPDADYGV